MWSFAADLALVMVHDQLGSLHGRDQLEALPGAGGVLLWSWRLQGGVADRGPADDDAALHDVNGAGGDGVSQAGSGDRT